MPAKTNQQPLDRYSAYHFSFTEFACCVTQQQLHLLLLLYLPSTGKAFSSVCSSLWHFFRSSLHKSAYVT